MTTPKLLNRINIRPAGDGDKDRWDAYVRGHPYASAYHLFAWKKAVEEAYGHRAYYLLAEEDNVVKGVLPLIYFNPPFISGCLVSLPFSDVGDVLTDDEDTEEKLIMEAAALAKRLNVKFIELRSRQARLSSFEYLNLPVNRRSHKVRMLLELPESSEMLWDGFKSKLRSQIRKAEKNNLSFEWGGSGDMDSFYFVFSRNMRDLGSPVHAREWFDAVLRNYGKNIRLGLTYCGRQLIGAGVVLSVNNMICLPWASTLREYNQLSPNMLLYWNFLKYASDNGYKTFDFGRSTPGEGTYKFKEQWGAMPVPLCWHYIVMEKSSTGLDEAPSSGRDNMARLWQKLPIGVANRLGPAIRKYISL